MTTYTKPLPVLATIYNLHHTDGTLQLNIRKCGPELKLPLYL